MSSVDNATPHMAKDYDGVIGATIPFYDLMQSETMDLIKTLRPDVACWLDTGCGTGHLVEMALPRFPDTLFIMADPSQAMLAEAKKRFANTASERLRFLPPIGSAAIAADILPLAPQVITAILCHHYLDGAGRQRAVRSCCEVLAPGGVFVQFENIDFGESSLNQKALERWAKYQKDRGRPPAQVESHVKRFGTEYFPITIAEHLDLLSRAGFATAGMFWLTHMQAGFYAVK
ncbi:MAG: class I SAM-dependent methyltransferase [Syntrophobacteraceae bacterium]